MLLAGLNTPGITTVIEQEPTRDHTERMLGHFGAEVAVEPSRRRRARRSRVTGQPELARRDRRVPGDPSSAAFPLVAALIVPGSRGDDRAMSASIRAAPACSRACAEMGADIDDRQPARRGGGEPVADLVVRQRALRGVEVPAARAPSMIDEYPVLAVAAAVRAAAAR